MKSPWIDFYCPQSGETGSIVSVKAKFGVSFEFSLNSSDLTDIEKTCYPKLFVTLQAPLSVADLVQEDIPNIPETLSLRVLPLELDALNEALTVYGGIVSDAYTMDDSLSDSKFESTLYTVVDAPTADDNDLPYFETPVGDV